MARKLHTTGVPAVLLSPSALSRRLRVGCGLLLAGLALASGSALSAAEPAVKVVYDQPWAPGDKVRDGAAEMTVLLCAAGLQQSSPLAGIVGVGNRDGAFQPGTEAALARVACMGLAIVRTAKGGVVANNANDTFVDAGNLSVDQAKVLLADCLKRYGPPPAMADAFHPTQKEREAVKAKLALYQFAFNAAASGTPVAMR